MKVKNLVLGVGIFIVFMFLLHNGIRAFYKPAPEWEDYCGIDICKTQTGRYPVEIKTMPIGQSCTNYPQLTQEQNKCFNEGGQPVYEYDEFQCPKKVLECDFCQRECQKKFDMAMQEFNKVVFIIALIVGIIILLAGYMWLSVEPVGSALMASGIGAIVYGTIINWENLGNMWRFLLLLIAFVLLVWIALKLNTSDKKGFWQKLGMGK